MGVYGAGLYGAGVYSPATAITAAADSAWPPRMIIEITGLALGADVNVYRLVSGVRTLLRGGAAGAVTDPSYVIYDGEYPFGRPFTYVVTENGADAAATTTLNQTLAGGKVVLSDPITGAAAEVVITAWPEKDTSRVATKFPVGGRTTVVSAPRGGAESQVEFLTETDTGRAQMIALLDGLTSGILLLRQPGGYSGMDGAYAVLGDTETRYVQRGTDERRLWTLDLVESDGWAPTLHASGWTFGDVTEAYAELSFADLAADFGTFLDITVFDWGTLL